MFQSFLVVVNCFVNGHCSPVELIRWAEKLSALTKNERRQLDLEIQSGHRAAMAFVRKAKDNDEVRGRMKVVHRFMHLKDAFNVG